jgi:hypothetical protein
MSSNFGAYCLVVLYMPPPQNHQKTIFPCLVESLPEGYPRQPPPLREPLPHILHVVDGKCEPQVRDLLAGITRGGGGEERGDLRNGAIR